MDISAAGYKTVNLVHGTTDLPRLEKGTASVADVCRLVTTAA